MVGAMPEAGLEPARGKAPWDFKSHVSTSSTTPACGQIVGEGFLSRNTAETGWGTIRSAPACGYPSEAGATEPLGACLLPDFKLLGST